MHRGPTSKRACAPVLFSKSDPKCFCLSTVVRQVNAQTEKNQWLMPHFDARISRLVSSMVLFQPKFVHGYWQYEQHRFWQDSVYFHHTSFRMFKPRRVQHSASNLVEYLQSSTGPFFLKFTALNFTRWFPEFRPNRKDRPENLWQTMKIFLQRGFNRNLENMNLL